MVPMDFITDASPKGLLLGTLLALLTFNLCKYYFNVYTYWTKRGVKGPTPLPFVGNLHTYLLGNRPGIEIEFRKKYGKIYGSFMGSKPRLVIADPEVLQQICIKDFDLFPNHYVDELMNKSSKSSLIFLQDDHWKRARALFSPTFTSGKIKRMILLLDRCADDLVALFGEQLAFLGGSTNVVNIKELYQMFTMDAITTCCYGLKLERTPGSLNLKTAAKRNEFVRLTANLFKFRPFRLLAPAFIPRPLLKRIGFTINSDSVAMPLVKRVEQLIENRKRSSHKFNDYLQILLDAKLEDSLELTDTDLQENHHAGLTHESLQADQLRMAQEVREKSKGESVDAGQGDKSKDILSEHEIVSNAVFLLLVGLETTASLLSHCSYALAFHQDIQERLYQELKKIAEYNGDKSSLTFDYEELTSCRYLDSVLSETLRLLNPVMFIDRKASTDYVIEKYNITVQKGTILDLAFHAVHNDPDYWQEPEKFDPERFMPGNRDKIVPGSYCPFGIGPRHCLGMRFSLTEAKLSLAKIMMKYRFDRAPNTEFPPTSRMTFFLFNMSTPFVRLTPRY